LKLTDYFKALNEGKQMELVGNIGYVIFPNCIRRCLRVSSEELMLFTEICSLYNETKKYAYPTQQTLAMSMGVTASTVCRILLHLRVLQNQFEEGLIIAVTTFLADSINILKQSRNL
jgi:hypothetical protein